MRVWIKAAIAAIAVAGIGCAGLMATLHDEPTHTGALAGAQQGTRACHLSADTRATAWPRATSPTGSSPLYRIAATPDFLNQDVGDVRGLPGWDKGDPNTWTPQLQDGIDRFFGEITDYAPDSVLVPGDLNQGHWGYDKGQTGIFGPTRTAEQRRAALCRAGNLYYSTWADRFQARGLTVHAAMGDHEIGDNPWNTPHARFRLNNLDVFKGLFAKYLTENPDGTSRYTDRPVGTPWADTAYATQLSPDVLLVSVDVFDHVDGDVHVEVTDGQLAWLEQVLRDARAHGTQWIIVQGHTPVAGPVRHRASSDLSVEGGTASEFWQTMAWYGVNLYLSGEVHDTSMLQDSGVTQISTGGLLYFGQATWMSADVYQDRIEFTVHEFHGIRRTGTPMWQSGTIGTRGNTVYRHPSKIVGALTLHADGTVTGASGKLAPYQAP
jgi:hypothetical protein